MQAVILAGGLGTRLRPLTLTRPKPLLPVANVPMVQRVIDRLPEAVDRVVLAVSYRLEDLEAYFDAREGGPEVVLVEETEPLGTGGAIKNVEREIDGPFFVFNGDVLSSLDPAALWRFHQRKGGVASLALWRVDDPRHFGVMRMDGDRILEFVEKPETRAQAPSDLANAGTYLLEPDVLDHIPAGEKVSVERATFPALLSDGRALHGMPFQGWWVDCGRPETYLRAHDLVLEAEGRDRAVAEGADVAEDARLTGWASLGAGARIEAGATAGRAVLLPRARVAEGAVVRDSVLGEGAVVEQGATVTDAVLADGARVAAGASVKGERVAPEETAA